LVFITLLWWLEDYLWSYIFFLCLGSSLGHWLGCQTYVIYLCLAETCCSFIFKIWDFIWWYIMIPETWYLRFVLCCWENFVWWFSDASFWKHGYVCSELIKNISSKLFWIIVLFAWFIGLKSLGCYKRGGGNQNSLRKGQKKGKIK